MTKAEYINNWRSHLISYDEAEDKKKGFIVFCELDEVEAAGIYTTFDLSDGVYDDLEVAKMRADTLTIRYPYRVADYMAWVSGNYDYLYSTSVK